MDKFRPMLIFCLSLLLPGQAFAQNIVTVAGGGPNNVAALSAGILPSAVAVDAFGNYYLASGSADAGASEDRVFRLDTNGQLTVYAGNGTDGFSGDGGPATSAQLSGPRGITIDSAGNLFIADFYNNRVRRVDAATQEITTVAGNGTAGFSGEGGPATSAELDSPFAVAVDSVGNLFIADLSADSSRRIHRVDAGTKVITAVPVTVGLPGGIATDNGGNLYVTSVFDHKVYRLDAGTQLTTVVAGNGYNPNGCLYCGGFSGDGGPATAAALSRPAGIAIDRAGDLFIIDSGNNRIRRVDATTQVIITVAGNGAVISSGDGGPAKAAGVAAVALAVDRVENLFIADVIEVRVRRVDAATGLIAAVAGNGTPGFSGDGGAATSAQLSADAVAVDDVGDAFVADASHGRIRRVDSATGVIATGAGNGIEGFSGDGGPATDAALYWPVDLAFDSAGNLFIADLDNRVRRVDTASQTITTYAGNGTEGFGGDGGPATSAQLSVFGIALDGAGNLFIADWENSRIRRVDAVTQVITTVAGNGILGFGGDGGPATASVLNSPTGVAVDDKGNLFIADGFNWRVRRVDAVTQVITTVAGNGTQGFSGDGGPAAAAEISGGSVAVDNAGNLLIGDHCRVRRVDVATSVIKTIVGNGTCGFSGDEGPATDAELSGVGAIALDRAGNLLIPDGRRVRKVVANKKDQTISFAGIPNRVFIQGDSFTVSATASSGLTVTFTIGAGANCMIFSGTVQITGVGSCTVTAHQGGNDSYNPAQDLAQSFRILYAPAGQVCHGDIGHTILPPINQDGTTVKKQGSTVLAQFRVCDGKGLSVGAPGVVVDFNLIQIISGTTTMNVGETVSSATPDTQFRWDATDQQWIFNIRSKALAAGNTYVYRIGLNDGTAIMFQFGLS